uniref:Chemokine interleukin-8-like domain-containing protein n=1 Tax=Oncorhynchus mykiss TaxID=8022 RepID=A0A8C7VTF1_ONCMY
MFLCLTVVGCGPGLQRCVCIKKEARRTGRLISKIQFNAPSSSCNVVEIIATLKTSGQEVCLDVTAPWVRKILEEIKSTTRLPLKELTSFQHILLNDARLIIKLYFMKDVCSAQYCFGPTVVSK